MGDREVNLPISVFRFFIIQSTGNYLILQGFKILRKHLYIVLTALSIILWRCAQVMPLNGGERDTQPPKLVEAVPVNASLNFKGRIIAFKFDEFVQVKDIANQLVVTPQTKELPYVEASGKKITVKFGEDLLPNTTYRLFFGNSISDMHEANVFSNFEFVFSTGTVIDSLYILGKTTNAFNNRPEKGVTVGLYNENEEDSVIFKKKPLYFTKAAEDGSYKLSYLPKSTFKAFAFTDINKNLIYDGGEEMIGFADSKVTAGTDSVLNMNLFKEEVKKLFIKKAYSPYYGAALVIYNKEQDNIITSYYKDHAANIIGENGINDTCKIYYRDVFDTLRVLINHPKRNSTDTVSIPVSSKERFERIKAEKKLFLSMELSPVEGTRLDYFAKPVLVFNNWMDEKYDSIKMILQYKADSLVKTRPQLSYLGSHSFALTNKLLPNTNYDLIIDKGTFKSTIGLENDSAKFSFKTTEPSDYGILNARLFLPRKENYIVQVLNDKDAIIAQDYIEMSLTSSAEQLIKFNNLRPGNYFLKVIEDKNQNKKWDTGNIFMKKQAETIYFNAVAIKLLADWDSETVWKVE